jgi:pimeloyl-[acyl-carrier protein] synthase
MTSQMRTTAVAKADRFDPNSSCLWSDPYPTYARFRAADPVHWGIATNEELQGSWYTFGYEDGERVLADTATFASDPASVGMEDKLPPGWQPISEVFQRFLGGIDRPEHDRLRSGIMRAFTARRVAQLRGRIEEITSELLDDVMSSPSGRFDLMADFAFPLPMTVIGDMLGVPPGDRSAFRDVSSAIASAIDDPGNAEQVGRGVAAIVEVRDYFRGLLADRRRQPADDLLTAMVQATDSEGISMGEEQLIAIAIELVVAGHETTVNAIGLGVLGLSDDRPALESVAAAATDTELDAVVDEVLRWTSPSQRQRNRWATSDVVVGERTIRRGDPVVVVTGAANRDPVRFRAPDQIDFSRPPARNLTFGFGPHFCLGAALARLELRVALPALASHLSAMCLPSRGEVAWRENSLLPGPAELWVAV